MTFSADTFATRLDRSFSARIGALEGGLSRVASARIWRAVTAVVAAALTAACFDAGLSAYQPGIMGGVAAGLVAGLVAAGVADAAVCGVAAVLVAAVLAPANAWGAQTLSLPLWLAIASAVAAALGAGVRTVVARRYVSPTVFVWAAVVFVIGTMWASVLTVNSAPTFDPTTNTQHPSFDQQLAAGDFGAVDASDDAWFYRLTARVHAGGSYYPIFAQALKDNPNWAPTTVWAFRMPTLVWFLALVPDPVWVPRVFLVLATLAVMAVPFVTRASVRMPLAVPACAALAAYFAYFPIQVTVFSQEAWAAAIGVLALAAAAHARTSRHFQTWLAVAVVLAVLAACIRETIAFLLVAGLISVAFEPAERRRFAAIAWGAGAIAFGGLYAAHAAAVAPYLKEGASALNSGGLRFAGAAFVYATDLLGLPGALPFVLAALGIAGALLVTDTPQRVLGAGAVILPVIAFLFVGNKAWYEESGEIINYWGATVVPFAYALLPAAFALLPGARLTGPGVAAHSAKPGTRRSGSANTRRTA
ncbi:MAG TPA: hypothetical protein VFG89_06170 [Coriobacteriia bacterium]|nr:hypothetical protein [Coriobacteriia bacterium]